MAFSYRVIVNTYKAGFYVVNAPGSISAIGTSDDIATLEAKVDQDINNLTNHMLEAAVALGEVDGRLDALEAFKNSHETISPEDIEGLFATQTE